MKKYSSLVLYFLNYLSIAMFFIIAAFPNSYAKEPNDKFSMFEVYNLGFKSDLDSIEKKLIDLKYTCIRAKSISLDTEIIPKKALMENIPTRLKELFEIDSKILDWQNGSVRAGNFISVLSCSPNKNNPIDQIDSYHSNITGDLLCFHLIFADLELVKTEIVSKYGKSMYPNYWEKGETILIMYQNFEKWQLKIFYEKSIAEHFNQIKKEKIKQEKIKKNKIKSVFK